MKEEREKAMGASFIFFSGFCFKRVGFERPPLLNAGEFNSEPGTREGQKVETKGPSRVPPSGEALRNEVTDYSLTWVMTKAMS